MTRQPTDKSGGTWAGLIGGAAGVLLGIAQAVAGGAVYTQATASESYPSIEGTVVSTAVDYETHGGSSPTEENAGRRGSGASGGSFWGGVVTYRYEVDGHSFTSDSATPTSIYFEKFSTREAAESWRATLREGDAIPVYVAPDDPSVSVLVPGGDKRLGLLVLGMSLVPLLIGGLVLRHNLHQRSMKTSPSSTDTDDTVNRHLITDPAQARRLAQNLINELVRCDRAEWAERIVASRREHARKTIPALHPTFAEEACDRAWMREFLDAHPSLLG